MSSGNTSSQYEIGSKIKWIGGRATAAVKKEGVVVEVVKHGRKPKTSISATSHSGTFKVETYVARDKSRHAYWVSPEALISTSRTAAKTAAAPKKSPSKKEVVGKATPAATVKKESKPGSPKSSKHAPAKQVYPRKSTTPAKGLSDGAQAASKNDKKAAPKIEAPTSVEDREVIRGSMPEAFKQQFPALMQYLRPSRRATV